MSATISITDTDVFTAMRTFLVAVLPTGAEVVKAQDNGVPMPKVQFVAMNNNGYMRLNTNIDTYVDTGANPSQKKIETHTEYRIQLDFYGADSSSWAAMVYGAFRDSYASDLFPTTIQPLYTDNPIQMPLITGEEQYLQRWKMQASLQINPVVTVNQDLAKALSVGLGSVDVSFPP